MKWVQIIGAFLVVGLIFFAGDRYATWRMQAAIDAAQVKADKAAIDKRMAIDAMEAKSRADAQAFEDQLNAIPDTGPACVQPSWVR
jgi:hypothetical protein